MSPYLMPIQRHMLRWHTYVFLDRMEDDEAWESDLGRVHRSSDPKSRTRQFIGIPGLWTINAEIKDWLEEANIPYVLRLDSTKQPLEWSLGFEDKSQATMFKLRWWVA